MDVVGMKEAREGKEGVTKKQSNTMSVICQLFTISSNFAKPERKEGKEGKERKKRKEGRNEGMK
jgi:hypothetical protein